LDKYTFKLLQIMVLTLNKLYWREYSTGKFYFDKYSYEGVRRDCLDEVVKHKFKYPRRCRKQFIEGKYQWRQYLGAGITCTPEYK